MQGVSRNSVVIALRGSTIVLVVVKVYISLSISLMIRGKVVVVHKNKKVVLVMLLRRTATMLSALVVSKISLLTWPPLC